MSLLAELEALERELLRPEVRHNRARLEELLAPEFREFGRSGRVWDRASMVKALAGEAPRPCAMTEVAVVALGPGVALLTYQSEREGRRALRSSVWLLRDGRWQVVFHQGTPLH